MRLKFNWKTARTLKHVEDKKLVHVSTRAGQGTSKDGDKVKAGFKVLAVKSTRPYDPFARATKKYEATVYAENRDNNRARKGKDG
jgi:hypothetical protein